MTPLTDYQEARKRLERDLALNDERASRLMLCTTASIRLLLSGPPVTAEEIGDTIFMAHEDYRSPLGNAGYAAQAILALLKGTKP